MGCSASEPEVKEFKKGRPNTSTAPLSMDSISLYSQNNNNTESNFQIPKEQIDIISKFNSNFPNSNGIQLSTLAKYQLVTSKENTSIISISSNEKYFKCLKGFNCFSSNIDQDNNFMLLKSSLGKMKNSSNKNESKNYLNEFHLNLSQKIYCDYNFIIKLKSIKKNEYDIFEFNKLDIPILIIFFDILSYNAISKIKEISSYRDKCESNPDKKFLFLPIMNIFVKEDDDITKHKQFLELSQLSDCYILTHPVNSLYIKLFQLDSIESAKVIIINCNSEIAYISNDQIEFVNQEVIDFYLHTRNSQNTNDYFTEESKNKITNCLKNEKVYKNNIEKIRHDFMIQISFQEIENKKYPVHINVMYNTKDQKVMKEIIEKMKKDFQENTKKYFLVDFEVIKLKREIIEAFEYINGLLVKENIISDSSNYSLESTIINYGNNNKKKKYILNYQLNEKNGKNFNKIYEILSSNLYNNPQFAKMGIGYTIIPTTNVELDTKIKNCKKIKLFKTKKEQIEYEDNNKFIDYEFSTDYFILLNPNYFVSSTKNKEKIVEVLNYFKKDKIKYTLCVFSYNEIDAQKLRFLNYEDLFEQENEKIEKNEIIYLCSSDIENYSYLKYYSEDIKFSIFHVDVKTKKLMSFFDMNLILSSDFYFYLKNNKIIENHKTESLETVKRIHSVIINFYNNNVKINLQDFTYNKIFTSINFELFYRKILYFTSPSNFSEINAYCSKIWLNFTFFDFLSPILKIDSFEKNLKKDVSHIFHYSFNKIATQTLPLPSNQSLLCSKCKEKIGIETNNSFYICIECKEPFMICEKCFNELSYTKEEEDDKFFKSLIMRSSNSSIKPSSLQSHEHDLVYIYKPNYNNKTLFITELYKKYSNKLFKKNGISLCSFCDGYIYSDSHWLNIFISHMKTNNDLILKDNSLFNEIFICDSCFDGKEFEKKSNEYLGETVLILRKQSN